jgi:acyl carrier protein
MSMNTEQRLLDVLNALLKDKGHNVILDSNIGINNIPNMDSLFFLEIVVAFEKEFEIRFELEDLASQNNIKGFIDIIESQII